MGMFGGLNIGARALTAYQTAMQVIGHNIANVNTAGYSRQESRLAAGIPDLTPVGAVGTGVEVTDIKRIRDAYLDLQMQSETATQGEWDVTSDVLSKLELYFNEPSDTGLSTLMDGFWSGWQDVSNSPEDPVTRSELIQQTLLFTNTVNDIYTKTVDLRRDLDSEIKAKTEEVNSLASQIAELNGQIQKQESGGATANDLRDQRDSLVTQLSSLITFDVSEQSNGNYSLTIKGTSLVWGTTATAIKAVQDTSDPLALTDIVWEETGAPVSVTGAQLGSLVRARDTLIPEYADKLDQWARALIGEVNAVYSRGRGIDAYSSVSAGNAVDDAGAVLGSAGSGLEFHDSIRTGKINFTAVDASGSAYSFDVDVTAGSTTLNSLASAINSDAGNSGYVSASVSGGILTLTAGSGYTFSVTDDPASPSGCLAALGINSFFSGAGASDISVDSSLQENPLLLSAAVSSDPGDNSNALAIAALRDSTVSGLNATFESYYSSSIIGNLGVDSQEAAMMKDNQDLIVNQLADTIAEVSGVSLDEEMTKLIEYQKAYGASAKYITMVSLMLDDLLGILR